MFRSKKDKLKLPPRNAAERFLLPPRNAAERFLKSNVDATDAEHPDLDALDEETLDRATLDSAAEGPAEAASEPAVTPSSPLTEVIEAPSVRRVQPWMWWTGGVVTALLAGLAASWFLLPIKLVEVTGNRHLSVGEVKRLAGIKPEMGWLYYGQRQARGLMQNPWVQSAVVTRQFPDKVSVAITERRPFLKSVRPSGEIDAVSEDGKLLPGAANVEALPSVTGWGPERLADAVLAARVLSRYTVQSVAYTPTGLTVKTAGGTVWSGDLKSLVKYAGSISMYPNQNINIYPWGVSVQ